MAKMKIWLDEKADFLEVTVSNKKGFFRDIGDDIFERVDSKGNIIGFAIFNLKKRAKLREEKINLPFNLKITKSA